MSDLRWDIQPPRVRSTDPATSRDAAEISSERMSQLKAWIVEKLTGAIYADHELVRVQAAAAGRGESPLVTPQRVRTARRELADAGLLESADFTVPTATGRRAQTWTAVSS